MPPLLPEKASAAGERGTFLQRIREGEPVSSRLSQASLLVGAVAWLYTRRWVVAVTTMVGFYLAAALLYTGLSYLLGWRRLHWFGFLGTLFDLLTFFR